MLHHYKAIGLPTLPPRCRYDEVKADVGGDAETLWSQASETYNRARRKRRGKEVGVDEVRGRPLARDTPRLKIHHYI